jgi:glycosyltransferase involved in cell wall biosynthesis
MLTRDPPAVPSGSMSSPAGGQTGSAPGGRLRILVVNWQDRENPQAGGAETHLHEIFGRLARRGHSVTLLCGGWPGSPRTAVLDGIEVTRVGTRHTFPLLAYGAYRSHLARRPFDVLIEDLNKLPLLTPWWVRREPGAPRVIGLVHHLFGMTAFQAWSPPLATAVWLGERPLGHAYRQTVFQAVSRSTADDLVARGIPRDQVQVIYQGVDTTEFTPDASQRSPTPLFTYLGRLKRYKGVQFVIAAFARLDLPTARLAIAGAGDYRPGLEALVRSLDLTERVQFLGRVSEAEKLRLLRQSWALTFASPKEGWGITNLEAAASGTPVVASNSPGIRESVLDGQTGFLVPHADIDALAAALERFGRNPQLVTSMGAAGRRFAETLTWDRAACETEAHLQRIVGARAAQ